MFELKTFGGWRLSFLVLVVPLIANAQPGPPGAMERGPTKAGVVTLERQTIPKKITLSGQTISESNAAIRPLVDGMITKIFYKAGDEVKQGAPLFQIEQATYLASLDVAKADLASAKAAVPSAEETLKRYEKLSGAGVSKSEVDKARTELQQAQAKVRAAEAALKTAQINLDRTTIRSPITGRVATSSVSIGDLVTAGQADSLTQVRQLDPITVDLAETSSRYLDVRKKLASGELKLGETIKVELLLENGEIYEREGTVENVGSSVSTTTGTLTVRVRFDNPDGLILPGVFLRARLTLGEIEGFLIPQLAAEPKPSGAISIWTLDAQNKARQVSLQQEGSYESYWIVTRDLEDQTILLVDNLEALRSGTEIQAVAVRIDDKGVVRDSEATTSTVPSLNE